MAAKNRFNPIDCLEAALPDEEYFVFIARDPGMPSLLGIWASLRVGNLKAATDNFMALMSPDLVRHYQAHPDTAKSEEAIATANRAIEWRNANLNGPNGRPTWKDSLVRPKMMRFEHPPCQQLAAPDLADKLIDAVAQNCDTANLDRDEARKDVLAILHPDETHGDMS